MFVNRSDLIARNTAQLNYGIAVADIDGDDEFEIIIAGFSHPNTVLRWNGRALEDVTPSALLDIRRQAIGVAGADIDGDGCEELYILNTDTFAGQKRFADRLFDYADGEWVDLFSLPLHQSVLNLTAGRSVAAVDRLGRGRYGFFVANYGGPMRLYELDDDGHLYDAAPAAQLDRVTGGRSVVALPIVSPRMDIFAGNENGPNFLFYNNGDGTFSEMAEEMAVHDPIGNARGVAALDVNSDSLFDLVVGNWEGVHRLFVQRPNAAFQDLAPGELRAPSRVRTVIAADFDNDGYEEIFFNNLGQPNRLFAQRSGVWVPLDPGAALEPNGLGTGAAVGDFDHDGMLELLIAHGESGMQPLALYKPFQQGNHWLRVAPQTVQGAPARGAVVMIEAGGRTQVRGIDAGSGYLCQMEPVAHFGLGMLNEVDSMRVRWLDGREFHMERPPIDSLITVPYPHEVTARF
jgi:hypothetical protein